MCKSLRVSVGSEKRRLDLDISNSILCSSSGECEASRPNRLFSEPTLSRTDLLMVVPASLLFTYSFFLFLHTMQTFKRYSKELSLKCQDISGSLLRTITSFKNWKLPFIFVYPYTLMCVSTELCVKKTQAYYWGGIWTHNLCSSRGVSYQ